jgi:type IV secretory pathway VirB2 component (pilin)
MEFSWFTKWGDRCLPMLILGGLLVLPGIAHAQTVDPTAIVTAILTWLTGPFGKAAVAVVVAITAFACMLGHHPYAALGAVVLGAFLLFGAQFFVTQFVGA